jgi:hypothetical protein
MPDGHDEGAGRRRRSSNPHRTKMRRLQLLALAGPEQTEPQQITSFRFEPRRIGRIDRRALGETVAEPTPSRGKPKFEMRCVGHTRVGHRVTDPAQSHSRLACAILPPTARPRTGPSRDVLANDAFGVRGPDLGQVPREVREGARWLSSQPALAIIRKDFATLAAWDRRGHLTPPVSRFSCRIAIRNESRAPRSATSNG